MKFEALTINILIFLTQITLVKLATRSSSSQDYNFWRPEVEKREPILKQSGFGWTVDDCLRNRNIKKCTKNNDIVSILNRFNISYLANYFDKTEEQIEKIKLCFKNKLRHFRLDEYPTFSRVPQILMIILLIGLFVISLIGNFSLFIGLLPTTVLLSRMKKSISRILSINKHDSTSFVIKNKPLNQKQAGNNSQITSLVFYFWVSAIFDLLWSVIFIPLHTLVIYHDTFWVFGNVTCKLYGFLNYLIVCVSSLIMITIAIDRYVSIVLSLSKSSLLKHIFILLVKSNNTPDRTLFKSTSSVSFPIKTSIYMISLLVLSILITMPFLFYTNENYIVYGQNCFSLTERKMCVNRWSDETIEFYYKIIFFLFIYILPGVLLCFTYGSIVCTLMSNNRMFIDTIIENDTGVRTRAGSLSIVVTKTNKKLAEDKLRSKKRVIKLLIIDCLFYIVCWFPFSLWVIVVSVAGFMRAYKGKVHHDLITFQYLYSIAILNVSLKWLFRILGFKFNLIKKFFARYSKAKKVTPTNETFESKDSIDIATSSEQNNKKVQRIFSIKL